MPKLTTITSNSAQIINEIDYYLQTDTLDIDPPIVTAIEGCEYYGDIQQSYYELPLGKLRLLTITLDLSDWVAQSASSVDSVDIEKIYKSVFKTAVAWQKACVQRDAQNKNDSDTFYYISTFDIKPNDAVDEHSLSTVCFVKELCLDFSERILQIFSWQDWQKILIMLQTPSDLWRFLSYRYQQLKDLIINEGFATAKLETEPLLEAFTNSPLLFTQALAIDNVLIKASLQDRPNSALVAMSLAQKNNNATAKMYQQHLLQAATLWSQLSTQMTEQGAKSLATSLQAQTAMQQSKQWHKQLLDESLFSRHELVRSLYQHPKQSPAMIASGYVVHHHSYESLGRHYLLIFYGQAADAQQNKNLIQPNLQKIAQDVATRLPLAELHHVVILGIEFISEASDTFIDIDLWIQPTVAMTPRERQLTKQLQRLKQHETNQQEAKQQEHRPADKLSGIQLNLSMPAGRK